MADPRWIAVTPLGQRIRLSEDGWTKKIVVSHPEFSADGRYESEVRLALESPEAIVEGWHGELLALRACAIAPKSPKHVCVVFREGRPEGFVITAFFVSRHDRLMRRNVRWPRKP